MNSLGGGGVQRRSVSRLEPGMCLAVDVLRNDGVLLLKAGVPLSEQQIQSLDGVVHAVYVRREGFDDVLSRAVVPDEPEEIRRTLVRWCDEEKLHLVLCTGGTGLSPRDRTPETLTELADRVVPGFGETMRLRTLAHTPRAFLSRGLAVTRERTLLIAFPGSERGARQCFEAILPGLRHGVETLAGIATECGAPHRS